MITAALVAFAVYLMAGKQIADKLKSIFADAKFPEVDGKHVAVAALLIAAALSFMPLRQGVPTPAPGPTPPDSFSLRGKFTGDKAAEDATTIAEMCDALADCIEYDGSNEKRLKTGAAFDDLRVAARQMRCRGESIGERQPQVRDAIHQFLDDAVGSSGGPVTDEDRAEWVAAFRDIARAAANVTK
jgi:hypothetical protein